MARSSLNPYARRRRKPRPPGPSNLENRFMRLWTVAGGPPLEAEFKFHPTRRWRADFVHHPSRTLFEVEGGVFSGGRHTRGKGYVGDCEKYLEAWLLNYAVVRLTAPQLTTAEVTRIVSKIATLAPVSPVSGPPIAPVDTTKKSPLKKRPVDAPNPP